MISQSKRVLVTVKAYPNPSKKYEETVCIAGIDLDTLKWIRLYPIPFRDLDSDQKFKKYSIIEVNATKAKDDARPESFKVDSDSIKILEHLETTKDRKWLRRKELVLPTVADSFCGIISESESSDKSLGMFKPQSVDFMFEKAKPKDIGDRKECYAQLGFLKADKKPIEPIPYDFKYSFHCDGSPSCTGHTLLIIDREICQSFRKWRCQYKTDGILLKKIRERWLDRMCADSRDTYFFVGNQKRFRENFMVLGVFYPPL